jgi:hypothetical protein
MRVRRLDGMTSTQALLIRFSDHPDYRYHFHTYSDGTFARLLVFERGSLEILQLNFEVLLVDSTYKTNRFGMPLFNIVGVTAINTSFFVGFCFLDAEDTESFQWVLERIQDLYKELGMRHPTIIISDCDTALLDGRQIVFPETNHLLCVWHVFKNILAHCKAGFKKDLGIKDPNLSQNPNGEIERGWEGHLYRCKTFLAL